MWDSLFSSVVPILGPGWALTLAWGVWQTICLERARRWRDENEAREAEKRALAFSALTSSIDALANLARAQTESLGRIERGIEEERRRE